MVALSGRLGLQQAVPGLGELLAHREPSVRLATVQALEKIASPGALTHIDRAIEDDDRAVRLQAVRAVGTRGYKGALRRIEAVVMGKAVKELDLTEKMAFFEAYGSIAGPPALKTLSEMLLPRGPAQAPGGLGHAGLCRHRARKIRTPEAREILSRAARTRIWSSATRSTARCANRRREPPGHVPSCRGGRPGRAAAPGRARPAARVLRRAPRLKLYPLENAAVQNAVDDLEAVGAGADRASAISRFGCPGEFVFVNAIRLRLDLDNYASFSHLLSLFRAFGIGSLQLQPGPTARSGSASSPAAQPVERPAARTLHRAHRPAGGGRGAAFQLGEPHEQRRASAEKSQGGCQEDVLAVRRGDEGPDDRRPDRPRPNIKKIKRVVQGIVDQILNEETSLIGLTTIRDYDEYTFTHSVNVCIFSVALGKRLGFNKLQLYDLGHGRAVPRHRQVARAGRDPQQDERAQRRRVADHRGASVARRADALPAAGQQDLPYRAMLVAHEHHMKIDLTGYPRAVRPRGR